MIVVMGSRHDAVAAALIQAWPNAALCSAEDFTQAGWVWASDSTLSRRWVVSGTVVADVDITGVFVRRSSVYPEEFLATHLDDRSYLAAEVHAFLVFVLATTYATVVNPVTDGALGDEAIRAERWMSAACKAGVPIAPVRLRSIRPRTRRLHPTIVEVVGNDAFGDAPTWLKAAAVGLARELELLWATVVFDGRHRLVTITSSKPPGKEAVPALGRLLAGTVTT